MLKKNFGRFYVTQGNGKVQQGPASWITLINILLSTQEISNADAVPSNADNHSTTRRSHKQSLPVIIESGPSDLVIHGSRSQCSLGSPTYQFELPTQHGFQTLPYGPSALSTLQSNFPPKEKEKQNRPCTLTW